MLLPAPTTMWMLPRTGSTSSARRPLFCCAVGWATLTIAHTKTLAATAVAIRVRPVTIVDRIECSEVDDDTQLDHARRERARDIPPCGTIPEIHLQDRIRVEGVEH